ncbi:MAG TPA: thiamine diphosphokinase [Candidatus Limnocylindrales bacterium]|nr:thiamine diphosphokinase [Candidatus Limnocylindrales bacterium]
MRRRTFHALVTADGDAPDRAALDAAWPRWSDGIGLVVAADAGAEAAERLGFAIDVIVGDGDSLGEESLARFAAGGVAIQRSPADKDETDTELAIVEARRRGADRITIVGALGGARVDHALANVELLAHPALSGVDAAILDAHARISLVRAPGDDGLPVEVTLPGSVGGIVSLIPLGEVVGVSTSGFRYPLHDEPLHVGPARGLSNVRLDEGAAVVVRSGLLLVVETPVTLDP